MPCWHLHKCRVVELVLALEEHVQRLLLLVLNDLGESSAGGGAPPESEVIVGLAYLAVICNAAYGELLVAGHDCVCVCV